MLIFIIRHEHKMVSLDRSKGLGIMRPQGGQVMVKLEGLAILC